MPKTIKKTISILIIDDHKMIREGVNAMLQFSDCKTIFKVYESENESDSIELLNKNKIDIVLLDYQLKNFTGDALIKTLRAFNNKIKILALSNHNEYHYIKKMIDSGANGFILKDINPTELIAAIETILEGNTYYSQKVAEKLIHFQSNTILNPKYTLDKLTPRQIEIIQMISKELTNEEIALKLSISKRTVDNHRQNIMEKLGIHNSIGLINKARQLKIIA